MLSLFVPRQHLLAWRLGVVALASSGCILPYAIPPLRGEIGGTTLSQRDPALHVAGGTHLASGTRRRNQPFDVGAGGFFDWSEHGDSTKGAYVDTAVFVERSPRTRTSVGVRGELRWNPAGRGAGAKLRVDHEMFGATSKDYSGSDRCGFVAGTAYGTGALGVFAEAGHVWMPNDESAWTATAGVTMRIPSTVGLLVGIPGCK